MKIIQKQHDGDKYLYEVKCDTSDVARALQIAQEAFAMKMGLKPEAGKTPAQVAEEKMGIKDLDQIVAPSALDALVPLALDKKNIIPAYPPTPHADAQIKRGQPFAFTLEVTMRPQYELTSYEPVSVEVVPFEIPESAIDEEIASMSNQYTTYVKDEDAPSDAEVKAGDYVKIAIKATEDGADFKGLNTDGRTYAVGAGHMPEGFDSNVRGMHVGQTKSFSFDAPSFDENFNEKTSKVEATVTILELLKEVKPDFTDEWVKRNMPMFESADQMRTAIRKSIEMRERPGYESYLRQAVVSKWAERFEGKIADEVYEAMMAQVRENIMIDLQAQGKTWDDFVKEAGDESQITMMLMMQAREILVQGYVLDAIYRHFKLTISENDILEVCRTMNPNADPRQLHEQIKQHGQGFALRESAERFCANQHALDHADITYVKAGS